MKRKKEGQRKGGKSGLTRKEEERRKEGKRGRGVETSGTQGFRDRVMLPGPRMGGRERGREEGGRREGLLEDA